MSLRITRLELRHFRNYQALSLDEIGMMTILVGANAVGKTNIMEGIQLVTALESFRNPTTEQLIRWGDSTAMVHVEQTDGFRQLDVRLMLDSRGRHYHLNGKQRSRRELQGQLPAVLFSPDDLRMVKGGPELRRSAVDSLGGQVSKNYLSVKHDYEKILRQKNRLLKDQIPPSYLASVNEVLAKIGSQLYLYRMRIIRALRAELPQQHGLATASSELVSLEYRPSITSVNAGYLNDDELSSLIDDRAAVEEAFIEEMARRGEEELARKTTLVGPHRDKVSFFINGRPAADFASQGQARSLAISYKLSELKVIENFVHQKPLLLLDDVMSELDASRRDTLTRYVHDDVQTFITTTTLDYFTDTLLERANIVRLPMT